MEFLLFPKNSASIECFMLKHEVMSFCPKVPAFVGIYLSKNICLQNGIAIKKVCPRYWVHFKIDDIKL